MYLSKEARRAIDAIPKTRACFLGAQKQQAKTNSTTSIVDYSLDELEFMEAVAHYKKSRRRPYPTWSEIFFIIEALGYVKKRYEA